MVHTNNHALATLEIARRSVALCKCVLQPLGVQAMAIVDQGALLLSEDDQRSTSMGENTWSAE